MVCELAVAADHQIGFQPRAREASCARRRGDCCVVAKSERRASVPASGTGCKCRGDTGADHRPRHDYAIVVVHFHPVVVRDLDVGGVFVVHPQRLDAARQRCHAVVVAVSRMDVPLPVWRQVIERQCRTGFAAQAQIGVFHRHRFGFVGGQVLAELDVARMVEVEMLSPGQRAPGHQTLRRCR